MEKKRSKGVTIFAWLLIILNIFILLLSLDFKTWFDFYKSFNKGLVMAIILYALFSAAVGIVSGFGILKLKEIMRKIAVAINSLDVLFTILLLFLSTNDIRQYCYSVTASQLEKSQINLSIDTLTSIGFYSAIFVYAFCIALGLLLIFFFTRPKVKEQFK